MLDEMTVLTPALSSEEREKRSLRLDKSSAGFDGWSIEKTETCVAYSLSWGRGFG